MTDEEKQELCDTLFVLSLFYPEDMIWGEDALVLDQITPPPRVRSSGATSRRTRSPGW